MASRRTLDHYRVDADRVTGDWLTTPEHVGEVDMDDHLATPDTLDTHNDIHEFSNEGLPPVLTTVAITITWRG